MFEFSPGLFRGPRVDALPPGIKTIIDLQYSSGDVLWESDTKQVPNFYWEATVALLPPDKNRVKATLRLLHQEELKPIYMHCQSGVDRTGFMVAQFRMSQGWTKADAVREMFSFGMHLWFYWWAFFLSNSK